ncbi:MAG: ferredoxin-NADP reductase [Verrucomicrobiales bacterium]|jgi:ferredoxin-NADP reductase
MFDLESWTQPFYVAGWALVAGVAFIFLMILLGMRRRQQLLDNVRAREVALLDSQIAKVRSTRQVLEGKVENGWNGFANFVVSKKTPHAESGICSFYLKPKDKRLKLPPFQPGQHLVFQLPVPGQAQPVTRRYSLSDSRHDDSYRISVKRLTAPEDSPEETPAGLGSEFLHDHVYDQATSREDCHLLVSAPQGSFYLNPLEDGPIVLIGGGVGVTPMLSMFSAIAEQNPEREVWFFYGVRHSGEDILDEEGVLRSEVKRELATRENLHLFVHYSRPLTRDSILLDGNPGRYRPGRVTIDVLKKSLPSNNYRFFICGAEEMMDQLESGLEGWGVPEEHVFNERFGPPKKKPGPGVGSGIVRFSRSETESEFGGEDGCVLDTAERLGVPISNDCRTGACGTCLIPILSGKVKYPRKTANRPESGFCLTCSCVPDGDLVLDC